MTIQNLKLQDQLLSQFMDLSASGMPSNANLQAILLSLEEQRRQALETFNRADLGQTKLGGGDLNDSMDYMSNQDYENMCYANITRNMHKLKHWRSYVQNIQGSGPQDASLNVAEANVDDMYMVMQPLNKNILVETINQINDSPSPMKQHKQMRVGAGGVEFDCGIVGGEALMVTGGSVGGQKSRKDVGKQVAQLYNIPLDSILESNCEDT